MLQSVVQNINGVWIEYNYPKIPLGWGEMPEPGRREEKISFFNLRWMDRWCMAHKETACFGDRICAI